MFLSKISECKKVELCADVLAAFVNFKYFCSTWIFGIFLWFYPLFNKLCFNVLIFFISVSCSSSSFITSTSLYSRIWHNFSSSSMVYVVPLSLEAFSSLSCSSLSHLILKRAEIFRVASYRVIFPIRSWKLRTLSFSSFWSVFTSLASFSE